SANCIPTSSRKSSPSRPPAASSHGCAGSKPAARQRRSDALGYPRPPSVARRIALNLLSLVRRGTLPIRHALSGLAAPGGRTSTPFGVLLAAGLLLAAPAALAIDPDDLLPVDEAFVLRAEAVAPDRIELDWAIADGYYLYRHRMGVEPADGGFRADPAGLQLPAGKRHTDEFFGEVETYRGRVRAVLPGTAVGRQVQLKVRYQGCADLGICYPPQTRMLTVALPAAPAGQARGGAGDTGF